MSEMLTVGGLKVELGKAEKWMARYVQTNSGRWSYPAYDGYPGTPSRQVGEQDLLATSLLNAHQNPITSYYTLRRLMPELNSRLCALGTENSLIGADRKTICAVAKLFGVLDSVETPQVGLTKLSKVLHRKRPGLIPLYDKNIRRVYFQVGTSPRLSLVPGRNWEDFAKVWIEAVQHDLTTQIEQWRHLARLAKDPVIHPLRALDIVAWGLGETRNPPVEFKTAE